MINTDSNQIIVIDPAKQRWIIYSIALATFMCMLDNYIVNISLPAISKSFNVGIDGVSWIVIVYLLILTSAIPFFGKLGDRVGLIKIFIAGYIVFVSGSLLCGISSSLYMLIFSRFLQAMGGAVLYTVPSAIISRFLPLEKRGYSFGILATAAAVGFAMGSPLGGLITANFGWQWVFLINIPIGIIAIIIVLRKFPREKEITLVHEKFDIPGVLYCFFWLITLMFSLNMGRKLGWTSPLIVFSFLMSLVFLSLLIRQEHSFKFPLLDLKLFRIKGFTYPNLANFLVFMAANGTNFVLPFYLVYALEISAEKAGLVLMAFPVINMIIGPIAGKASDKKISSRSLCIIGASISLIATIIFPFTMYFRGLWPVITFLFITGFSLGLFLPPNNNQIMSSAPKDSPGMASGILRTLTNLGSVIGVAIFEIIFSFFFVGKNATIEIHAKTLSGFSPESIIAGLHFVIIFAAVLYGLALIFSVLTPGKHIL
ncbi:MAG: MFS transporter [Bacteroidia bacterium]|nr:MFS transporter [Bacteroidia bacterium]